MHIDTNTQVAVSWLVAYSCPSSGSIQAATPHHQRGQGVNSEIETREKTRRSLTACAPLQCTNPGTLHPYAKTPKDSHCRQRGALYCSKII